MTADYRDTVLMPRTGFPMKARLPEREPAMAARWEEIGLYRRLRAASAGRPKFVLHDGPPYANGHLHLGTALNKILKDVVVRSQQMLDKDSVYVPGWDCHGLPIEWQVEQAYRKEGRDKDSVPVSEFRADCRAFAEHWIDVQRQEFKRLGVIGDWDDPYTTMSFAAEAQIVRELGKFLVDGSLYQGARPVMWSPVEKTALAEAEIEYHDHTSVVITVAFPVTESAVPALDGGFRRHLDDDALDDSRQPLHRLWRGAALPGARSDRSCGRRGGRPGRPHRRGGSAGVSALRRLRHRRPPGDRLGPPRHGVRGNRLRPPSAGPGLRLSGAAHSGGSCDHRAGHRLRPYRARPRRRGLRGGRALQRRVGRGRQRPQADRDSGDGGR